MHARALSYCPLPFCWIKTGTVKRSSLFAHADRFMRSSTLSKKQFQWHDTSSPTTCHKTKWRRYQAYPPSVGIARPCFCPWKAAPCQSSAWTISCRTPPRFPIAPWGPSRLTPTSLPAVLSVAAEYRVTGWRRNKLVQGRQGTPWARGVEGGRKNQND